MVVWKYTLAALLGIAPASQLYAQEKAQGGEEQQIVVTGQSLTESEIVEAAKLVSSAVEANETMPRIIDPLCLSAIGFQDHARAAIKEMIETAAESLGIDIASAGCRPNALMVVVDDVPAFLEKAVENQPNLAASSHVARAHSQIASGRAAVVLHSVEPRAKNGARMPVDNTFPGFTGIKPLAVNARINTRVSPSRINDSQSTAVTSAVLVFDANALRGATYRQISDYGSMVLLGYAETRQWGADKVPSILSLFDTTPRSAPARMTQFDEIYLRGLYDLPLNAQARMLSGSVKRQLGRISE